MVMEIKEISTPSTSDLSSSPVMTVSSTDPLQDFYRVRRKRVQSVESFVLSSLIWHLLSLTSGQVFKIAQIYHPASLWSKKIFASL